MHSDAYSNNLSSVFEPITLRSGRETQVATAVPSCTRKSTLNSSIASLMLQLL